MGSHDVDHWVQFTKKRIIALAGERKITLKQLAFDIDKGSTYVTQITNLKSKRNVSIRNLLLIMERLGVTPQEFYDLDLKHLDITKQATNALNRLPESEILLVLDLIEKLAERYPEKTDVSTCETEACEPDE